MPHATLNPVTTFAPQAAAAVRGFALYVGITEEQLAAADTSLTELINSLKAKLQEVAPQSQSHATLAVAPAALGGKDLEVTRIALGEPGARAERKQQTTAAHEGLTIDLKHSRVLLNNVSAPFTLREFELLQFFATNPGRTITREDIIAHLWEGHPASEVPNARTIDVHIRRLRLKLAEHQDVIRTIRGSGYRFDKTPAVRVVTPGLGG